MNKYGFSTEEIKAFNAQLMKQIITILPGRVRLPTAFGSPYHTRPNGSASEIRSTPR
jgi:hypothetical protein